MISISKTANINYLAKVVKLEKFNPHPNAEKLKVAIVDFQEVIVGIDMPEGSVCIFFPLESQINGDFLSYTNSYAHSNLNRVVDDEHKGFFNDKGRVTAIRLRGQKSMGYLVPVMEINKWPESKIKDSFDWRDHIGEEFDTINDVLMLKKYQLPIKGTPGQRLGQKPKVSRLIEGLVHLHNDTENLRKNIHEINPEDYIGITYKLHGTSGWATNVLVKKRLNLLEKLLQKIGVQIKDTEYDYVYGSRKVVKNSNMDDPKKKDHFYEYDLWGDMKEEIKESIPKGYTIYYECVGFTKNGGSIQPLYDYGCASTEHKIFVYRITFTNEDGVVYNLPTPDIKAFCDRFSLNYVPLFYYGRACDLYPSLDKNLHWHENFMKNLERDYLEKDCFMCKQKAVEEGIVLRKESQFEFKSYKLKSFGFALYETKLLDEGVEDLESAN